MDDARVTISGGGKTLFDGPASKMHEATDALREHLGKGFKETHADAEVRARVEAVSAGELKQFIERWERLEAEKKDLAEDQAEIIKEAKARGYSSKAIKEVIRLRKMRPDDRAEFEAVVDLYRAALGV